MCMPVCVALKMLKVLVSVHYCLHHVIKMVRLFVRSFVHSFGWSFAHFKLKHSHTNLGRWSLSYISEGVIKSASLTNYSKKLSLRREKSEYYRVSLSLSPSIINMLAIYFSVSIIKSMLLKYSHAPNVYVLRMHSRRICLGGNFHHFTLDTIRITIEHILYAFSCQSCCSVAFFLFSHFILFMNSYLVTAINVATVQFHSWNALQVNSYYKSLASAAIVHSNIWIPWKLLFEQSKCKRPLQESTISHYDSKTFPSWNKTVQSGIIFVGFEWTIVCLLLYCHVLKIQRN